MSFKLDPARPPGEDDYYLGVALAVRRKANCTGNRVAAVVVKNKRIIATGYNGVPEGMTNCLDGGCLRWAVSSLKRDASDEIRSQCREQFVRGMEVEDLARAVVQ